MNLLLLELPEQQGRVGFVMSSQASSAGHSEKEVRKKIVETGKVLMPDAHQVYRKVTRTIYDLSLEQMKNLSAIVWLYRGQQHRFLVLLRDYLRAVCTESTAIPAKLAAFEKTLADLRSRFAGLVKGVGPG